MITPETLRQFPFLASFSAAQLEMIVRDAPCVVLPPHAIVFYSGERSHALYLILSGKVRIYRTDEAGEVVELGIVGEGQMFGELALLSNEPRMATVATVTACKFLLIERPLLLNIIATSTPEVILHLFSVLSHQMRAMNEEDFKELIQQRTLEARMEVEKQRGMTQMVAGVAHEINTPLGIINTAVSIIERDLPLLNTLPADTRRRRALQDLAEAMTLIQRNIHRAHKLVQEFKKVSVSQLHDELQPMNLADAVQETIDLAAVSLRRNKIQVELQDLLPVGQKIWVGYGGYLSQILLNLLTNAERYAYKPGQGGLVQVELALIEPEEFQLTVRDFGQGIPEEHLGRVFEPFFTTGRAIGGTGLGMTIVYNLVTAGLRGKIWLESAVGAGTAVKLTFPCELPPLTSPLLSNRQ